MIPGYLLLAQRIQDELDELERAVNRTNRAWQAAKTAGTDQDMFIDSAALNLHSFYAGLERLLEFSAYQLDGGPPKGPAWHKELLRQMSTPLGNIRPAMISPTTTEEIDEFRRFRHVVRNVYAEHLDPERVGDLVRRLTRLWPVLRSELEVFKTFLENMGYTEVSN